MARIFISYSRTDEPFARQLATSLSDLGADVWIDIEDIPVGMKWSRAIQEGLDLSDVLLVVITPESMASHNVEDEWQYYLDQKKPVIPLLLKPTKMHFQLSRIQYVDFNRQSYDKALRQLHAELGRKGVHLNPLPKRSTLTQPVFRVNTTSAPRESARTVSLTWLFVGVVLLVVGVGVGLFLSNQTNAGESPTRPIDSGEGQRFVTPTPPQDVDPTPFPTPPQVVDNPSSLPVYDSGGLRFSYPSGWVRDTISEGGGKVIVLANNQATLDVWIREDFSMDNAVYSGEAAIAIIPNVQNDLGIDSSYSAWDVAYLLRESFIGNGYTFGEVGELSVNSGSAAHVLGAALNNSIGMVVIDTGGDAGYVLIFGAAAPDQETAMTEAVGLIANSLEVH